MCFPSSFLILRVPLLFVLMTVLVDLTQSPLLWLIANQKDFFFQRVNVGRAFSTSAIISNSVNCFWGLFLNCFERNCQYNDYILEIIFICFSLAFVNHNYHYHTFQIICWWTLGRRWVLIFKATSVLSAQMFRKVSRIISINTKQENFRKFLLSFLQSKKVGLEVIRFWSNMDIPGSIMTIQKNLQEQKSVTSFYVNTWKNIFMCYKKCWQYSHF